MPARPCYAAIFTSRRAAGNEAEYAATADRMQELAAARPGFLGVESVRGTDGTGITVSYWESLEAISGWRSDVEHLEAQAKGREKWYEWYRLRICRVERESSFPL